MADDKTTQETLRWLEQQATNKKRYWPCPQCGGTGETWLPVLRCWRVCTKCNGTGMVKQ